jgi:hypothetical protein
MVWFVVTGASAAANGATPRAIVEIFGSTSAQKPAAMTPEQVAKALDERCCIKSIPWPDSFDRKSTDPWKLSPDLLGSVRRDIIDLDASYEKLQNASKDELNKLYGKKQLTQQQYQFITLRKKGLVEDQLRLYLDTLRVKALVADKKYKEALDVAAPWHERDDWKLEPHEMDDAEKSTYFSEPFLRNLMFSFEILARLETVGASRDEKLQLAADYLAARPALELPMKVIIGPGPLDARCVALLDKTQFGLDPESAAVAAQLAKSPAIAGVAKDGKRSTLYLAGPHPTAVRLDDKGKIEPLSPADAADDFYGQCERAVRGKSAANMQLIALFLGTEGCAAVMPGQTIELSTADVEMLRAGTALPDDAPLTKGLRKLGKASLVLYSHPLMLKSGPIQEKAEGMLFALAQAYPELRVCRGQFSKRLNAPLTSLTTATVKKTGDIVVLSADQSAGISGSPELQTSLDATGPLRKNDVRITAFNGTSGPQWKGGRGKLLIVVAGQSAADLPAYLEAVGKAGYFEGNVVVLIGCGGAPARAEVTDIHDRFKATAVYSGGKPTDGEAAAKMLSDLAGGLKGALAKGISPAELVQKWLRGIGGVWTM